MALLILKYDLEQNCTHGTRLTQMPLSGECVKSRVLHQHIWYEILIFA